MSRFSPAPVADAEQLARFVFDPIHVSKSGKIKPAIFSHTESKGCSVQRENIASARELTDFVSNFLAGADKFIWKGVLLASSKAVRDIRIGDGQAKAVCVYDTAEQPNPAHAEFHWSHRPLHEADPNELRAELMRAFGNGNILTPDRYRNGEIFQSLPAAMRNR